MCSLIQHKNCLAAIISVTANKRPQPIAHSSGRPDKCHSEQNTLGRPSLAAKHTFHGAPTLGSKPHDDKGGRCIARLHLHKRRLTRKASKKKKTKAHVRRSCEFSSSSAVEAASDLSAWISWSFSTICRLRMLQKHAQNMFAATPTFARAHFAATG